VAATLVQTSYPAGLLELEITEGVLIRNRHASGAIIDRLSKLGVGVALDDFGTGYSSLSYFEELKVDRLKIDRSFLKDIDRSGRKQSIIQAIIQFARSIDLETVVEGVETVSQLHALEAAGCTSVQGFLISPPLVADEFAKWCQKAPALPAKEPTLRVVGGKPPGVLPVVDQVPLVSRQMANVGSSAAIVTMHPRTESAPRGVH
jgi:EAL domain-containing protein (putative c-di-GMP-specific phosphodiesterase class I)